MDKKELKRLEEICEEVEVHSDRLTPWEMSFMSDIHDRIMEYGDRAFVSELQLDVITRIERKLFAT